MLHKKRALIFGVYGQDGSYLAHFLNTKNYKVFGTTRKIRKCLNFKKLNLNNKIVKKILFYFFLCYGSFLAAEAEYTASNSKGAQPT